MRRVADDVLLMRGKQWSWPESCNIWVYKSFAYGYRYHDKWWCAEKSWHVRWPQEYPVWWDFHKEEDFPIGESRFRIFSFDADVLGEPSEPYYIIMSKLRKDAAKWPHNRAFWEYRRGFVEIVPRWMYPTSASLRTTLETMNPASHFGSDDKNEPYLYVMATTFERLTLDARMATNANQNHECVSGIKEIALYDSVGGGWLPLSEAQLKHIFLPSAVGKGAFLEDIPLITVWELDSSFQHTGRLYVETLDRGTFVVRRPETICLHWDININPRVCTSWGPGWHCMKIDSSDYTNPTQEYKVVEGYHDCFIP